MEAARKVARCAVSALDQWLPIETAQTHALRATLTTILGTSLPTSRATAAALPSPQAMVTTALAAVRAMNNWLAQTCALLALAPYLEPGQLHPSYTDILAWSEEDQDFLQPYYTILKTDLAVAMTHELPAAAIAALLAVHPTTLASLEHEHLYAQTLVRARHRATSKVHQQITHHMAAFATTWCQQISEDHDERAFGPIRGLIALLPALEQRSRSDSIAVIEGCLLRQLANNRYESKLFRVALPALGHLAASESY